METSQENSFQLARLPLDIIKKIIEFLDQDDIANLKKASKEFNTTFNSGFANYPYIYSIYSKINAIGNRAFGITGNFVGIKDQANYLNLLDSYKNFKNKLNIVAILDSRSAPDFKDEINNLQKKLEALLQLPEQVDLQVTQLEAYTGLVKKKDSKINLLPSFNLILLRLYAEIIRVAALISPTTTTLIYKKLFLTIYLLKELGDECANFGLVEILTKLVTQGKIEELTYIKKILGKKDDIDNDYVLTLRAATFVSLGINSAVKDNKDFLSKFNDEFAFFYPAVVRRLLKSLIDDFGLSNALILYSNIPPALFQGFIINFNLTYKKIFSDQAPGNLQVIRNASESRKSVLGIMFALFKQPKLFSRLSLEEILKLPYELIDILDNHVIVDADHWNKHFESLLLQKWDRIIRVANIFNYWSLKDIEKLLNTSNEFFDTIVTCAHRDLFFSCFNFLSLKQLSNAFIPNHPKSLLELLAEKDNQLLLKGLTMANTNIADLINQIQANPTLQQLLITKNSTVLFKDFPIFFQQVCHNSFQSNDRLTLLLDAVRDKELFQLILKLSNGQLSIIEKNLSSIELLKNRVIRNHVYQWNLTFHDLNANIRVVHFISKNADEKSHLDLSLLPINVLDELYQDELLTQLLAIKSKTLFSWFLGNCFFSEDDGCKKVFVDTKQMKSLFAAEIPQKLNRLGFSLNRYPNEFYHCDYEIINHFKLSEIEMINRESIEGKNLLKFICSLNPCLVSRAVTRSNKDVPKFIQFFKSPSLHYYTTSFGWMMLYYFSERFINNLIKLQVADRNLLAIVCQEENKKLFWLMIKLCKTETVLPEDHNFTMQQPPSIYNVNENLFFELLCALVSSGFLFLPEKCADLLEKFGPDEIIALNTSERFKKQHSFSTLDFLSALGKAERLGLFMQGSETSNELEERALKYLEKNGIPKLNQYKISSTTQQAASAKKRKLFFQETNTKKPKTEKEDKNYLFPKIKP